MKQVPPAPAQPTPKNHTVLYVVLIFIGFFFFSLVFLVFAVQHLFARAADRETLEVAEMGHLADFPAAQIVDADLGTHVALRIEFEQFDVAATCTHLDQLLAT